jgi:hypothetical protein
MGECVHEALSICVEIGWGNEVALWISTLMAPTVDDSFAKDTCSL